MCYGHELQAKFHWHVEDQGIRHAYSKPSSPQLNGKVDRSHRTDDQQFYPLLTYNCHVDLRRKLAECEALLQSLEASRPLQTESLHTKHSMNAYNTLRCLVSS